jgi:hypothetical protein
VNKIEWHLFQLFVAKMSLFATMHKNRHYMELSVSEMLSYRQVLKKKLKYYQDLYEEAKLAEEENQDDYGMLATAQAEMDFAESKLVRCEKKMKMIDRMMVSKVVSIWVNKKKQ